MPVNRLAMSIDAYSRKCFKDKELSPIGKRQVTFDKK